jgi:hypothetical protein
MLPSVIDGLRPSKEPEPSPLRTPHSMGRSGTFKKGARSAMPKTRSPSGIGFPGNRYRKTPLRCQPHGTIASRRSQRPPEVGIRSSGRALSRQARLHPAPTPRAVGSAGLGRSRRSASDPLALARSRAAGPATSERQRGGDPCRKSTSRGSMAGDAGLADARGKDATTQIRAVRPRSAWPAGAVVGRLLLAERATPRATSGSPRQER